MRFNAELFGEVQANLIHLERWTLQAQFDATTPEEVEFCQSVRRHAHGLAEAMKKLPTRASGAAAEAAKT